MATPQQASASPSVSLTPIDNAQSFFEEGQHQLYCACCAHHRRRQTVSTWEVHHVLSKKHCRVYGAPRYSPDNALRLCAKSPRSCHSRHTSHQELLPLACLRDENIAFVAEHLGPTRAYEHLTRYYAGSDPRVDALLECP